MAQQKISLFGQFTPTGVDNTAGNSLRALAGLSDQVGGIAFQVGAKKAQKRGTLAGAQSVQRDESGEVISPELKNDFTIAGEAYNHAAILAHKAQISMDVREDLDRLQEEHKLDPEAFKQMAGKLRGGTIKNMPEELAVIVAQDIDSSVSSRFSTLQKQFFKRKEIEHHSAALDSIESLQDDILNATRTGESERQQELIINANTELDAWVESGVVSPDEARQVREDLSERMQEQTALSGIDAVIFNEDLTLDEQIAKGVEFVDDLRKSELKDLSPEQKDSLLNVVSSKVRGLLSRRNAIDNERDLAKEKIISNLKIKTNLVEEQAKNGEIVDLSELSEEVEELHSRGDISGNERTSIKTHIAKAQDEIDRISLADKRIIARLSGDNSILMNKKDVDFFYKRKIQDHVEGLPSGEKNAFMADFILATRSIPTQIKNNITSQILSGDPDQIKQAADLIDRIDNIPGLANKAVDANQRAFTNKVVELSQSMAPEQAINLSKELTDPRDKARAEANTQLIKTDKMESKYSGIVENAFEGFFGGDFLVNNVNKQTVEREYKELFESFFIAGDNAETAENKAIELLQTNWKESEFGFMKYRPEDYYSVSGDTDYMKKQLFSDISSGIGGDFNKKSLFLLSDDETARLASQGNPSYRVMALDNNGALVKFPGRWRPNVQKQRDLQMKDNLEAVKSARSAGKKGKESALRTLDRLKF